MAESTIKLGLFGAGKFGHFHANNIAQTDFIFAGVYDPVMEKAQELAAKWNVSAYSGADELMEVCDAVLIVSNTTNHFNLIEKAMRLQKHIFVEKPFVANVSELEKLLPEAASYNKVIQAGHIERFNPMLQKAFKREEKPWMIHAQRISPFNPRVSDVSVIHDLMIHDIDNILELTGSEVIDIQAKGRKMVSDLTDVCQARLVLKNGTIANLFAGRIFPEVKREMELFYSDRFEQFNFQSREIHTYLLNGMGEQADMPDFLQIREASKDYFDMWQKAEKFPLTNAILDEQKEFYNAISHGHKVSVSIQDAEKVMRIIEGIEQAMK